MTEPRTLKRLLLAVLSIFLAWQGQSRLFSPTPIDGVLLYGIAIVLFVSAYARIPAAQLARGRLAALPRLDPHLNRRQAALIGVALLLGCAGFITFANPRGQPAAWLLHILSLLSFSAAFVAGPHTRPDGGALVAGTDLDPANPPAGRLIEPASSHPSVGSAAQEPRLAILLLIVVLATFARLWQIDQFPFGTWYDEAFNGNAAVNILNDPLYRPVFVGGDTLPAYFDYLLAFSFKLFGVSTLSMRFVTAAIGIATVVLAYLVFRRWFGETVGLFAAALFAVMRYDLTFSRIALHGVTAPFFELAVLYWFDRVLERKRLSDTAWLAVTLGIGLAFYTPFRLFPIILIGMVGAIALAAFRRYHGPALRALWLQFAPHLAVFLIGVFVATVPIFEFALQDPDTFFARTSDVSIFERRDEPDLIKALWGNFSKHMLMFNWQGDRNGRHNLPNEPELDPLMGSLAVLGFVYALWRWRDSANLLMLMLFFVMNLGGILSVDFEAPQSLRSIGVMPALVYFAALPLAAVGVEVSRVFRAGSHGPGAGIVSRGQPGGRFGQAVLNAGLVALAGVAALSNLDTFFNRQENSPDVWASYSTAETIVAQEMNRLAPSYDLIVSSLFANHPTVRFVAPAVTNYQQWTVNDRLPLAREPGRGVAMLLDPLLSATVDAAKRYYAAAAYREFGPPSGGSPVVYEAILSNDTLRSVQGLVARYYSGSSFDGDPAIEEVAARAAADWTLTRPLSGTFSVEYQGALYVADYGSYRFQFDGAPGALLYVDETSVSSSPLTLARGLHALRFRIPANTAKFELRWQPPGSAIMQPVPGSSLFQPPVTNSGLLGEYFQSPDWSGSPAFTQIDPQIALYFHNIPLPRPYTVQWTGKLFAPAAGNYRISTESIDDSQVLINSQVVVNNRGSTTAEGSALLAQGWNDIVVRFADRTSHTHIYLYWTPPAGVRELIPSRYLSPPMGKYPTASDLEALPRPLPPPNHSGENPAGGPVVQPTPPPAGSLNLVFAQAIGQPGTGPVQFNAPRAVAVGPDGRIFVVDTANRRVQALDPQGNFQFEITGGGEPFVEPFDIVVTSQGNIVVLDSDQGWLYIFDPQGRPLTRIGGPRMQFYHPRGLSIDAGDNLYVADTGGSRVVKLTLDGARMQVFGTRGTGKGQFIEPSAAAPDLSGYLFATDVPDQRLLSFTADGQFVSDFPIPAAGAFNGPHIAFAPDQSVLVTAPELHKVQRYSRTGQLLAEWGSPGNQPGQFRLPTGIAVVGNTVWIADTGNDRIQKWVIR